MKCCLFILVGGGDLISVLMSVYKNDNGFFLKEAIDSILNQTIKPNQVVIVVDGPVPEVISNIIDSYRERFALIAVDFNIVTLYKNLGLGLALREGVNYCTEKYILRMDSDDISKLDRIEKVVRYIKANPDVDAFGSYIEEFSEVVGDLKRFRKVPLTTTDIFNFGKQRNPMNHVTMCIKKKSLLNVGNYESVIYHEDYYLWVKMLVSGLKLENIDSSLVNVRVGNDLIGRRIGINYFKLEFCFARKCINVGYFSIFDGIVYLIPRLFFRILPKCFLYSIYSKLRT